jgi:DNA-binding GntR family transcriptional regulator
MTDDGLSDITQIRRNKLSAQVADTIRNAVLTNRIAVGERVVQTEWADRLGVSRMPVRDAITQLCAEGILEPTTGGAAVVAAIDIDDIRDGYDLNAIISHLVARRAARRVTPEELQHLRELNAQIAAAHQAGDLERASALNWTFHRTITVAARSPRLMALLRLLAPSIPHAAFEIVEGWPEKAVHDHDAIIGALESGDSNSAGTLVEQHIRDGSRDMLSALGGASDDPAAQASVTLALTPSCVPSTPEQPTPPPPHGQSGRAHQAKKLAKKAPAKARRDSR